MDGYKRIPTLAASLGEALALGRAFWQLTKPRVVALLHPSGLEERIERRIAKSVARIAAANATLWLAPNHDPGRSAIEAVRTARSDSGRVRWETVDHLPRGTFVALLKRLAARRGVLIGNSSAGLIEAAAIGLRVVNIGPRQSGRERAANVTDVGIDALESLPAAVHRAMLATRPAPTAIYGDGKTGARIAKLLGGSDLDPRSPALLRKRNTY